MKNLILAVLICGFLTPLTAQIINLDEVFIYPVKYKYLIEVVDDDTDAKVQDLEMEIAKFDVTKEEYYSDEYDSYEVSFYIPEGYAVAAYDKEGNLLRTIERYKDVKLPRAVSVALIKRFPEWTVEKDIYKVKYSDRKWDSKKVYKLRLTNGDKTINVKTDEDGNFL